MSLRLNGKQLSLKPKRPSFDRLIAFLDSLSDNDLVTAQEITDKHQICGRDLLMRSARSNQAMLPYRFIMPVGTGRGYYVFGNKRAIIAVKKWADKEIGAK